MKRYDVRCKHPLGSYFSGMPVEEVVGDWVRYKDVIDLEQQLAEARAALRDILEWLPNPRNRPLSLEWRLNTHAAAIKAAEGAK